MTDLAEATAALERALYEQGRVAARRDHAADQLAKAQEAARTAMGLTEPPTVAQVAEWVAGLERELEALTTKLSNGVAVLRDALATHQEDQ